MNHAFDTYRDAARFRFMVALSLADEDSPLMQSMEVAIEQIGPKDATSIDEVRALLDKAMELANWEPET